MSFADPTGATFDGTAYSTMGVTGMPANNQAQSISLWVNLTSNAGVQNFSPLINLGTGSAVQVGIRNPDLVVWSYGGGTLASGPLPTTGAWHHVALHLRRDDPPGLPGRRRPDLHHQRRPDVDADADLPGQLRRRSTSSSTARSTTCASTTAALSAAEVTTLRDGST